MNPQQLIEKTQKSSTVAYHKFVLLSRGRNTDLFCFFEGNDTQYYSLRIKQLVSQNYHPISCGNKDNVLKTYKILSESPDYKSFKKAFFIDKDFDEALNNKDIYETPCYSVENFYVNNYLISEVLKNEMGLTEGDAQFHEIIQLFESEYKNFSNQTLLFNGWYCALKRRKNVEKLDTTNVSLDEKLPKSFICLKIGEIQSDYNLDRIKELFPNAIEVSEDQINEAVEILNTEKIGCNLRGKFQMSFLITFLQFLIDDSSSNKKYIPKKTKFRIDKPNIISQLTQYAVTPNCLEKYIRGFSA